MPESTVTQRSIPDVERRSHVGTPIDMELIDRLLAKSSVFLTFCRVVEDRFEADTGRMRVRSLRQMIFLGLIFFNIYDISGFMSVPQYGLINCLLRLCCMTPMALIIYGIVGRVGPIAREAAVGLGILGATAIPILVFVLSSGPLATALTTTEILLSLVYANITLALRFPWACIVSGLSLSATVGALLWKPELDLGFSFALVLNLTTGLIYSLTSAYRMEASGRRNYLLTLKESLRLQCLASDNTNLWNLSNTDALTGLANRRSFDSCLIANWCDRGPGQPLSLVLMDVDYFKRFNDYYGHSAGDACLKDVANAFRSHRLGPHDLIARYGGEEFAVLLPNCPLFAALALAEKLRLCIYELGLPHLNRDDDHKRVSISIGIASTEDIEVSSSEELIEMADAALYAAKSLGRNRVSSEGKAIVQGSGAPSPFRPMLQRVG